MWCNYKFTPQYCGPQNCGPTRIDRFLVAFGRVLQNLVAFGRIFRSLFGYTGDSINHLIDKTFDSHQEYTIATSSLAPARGTAPDPQPAAVINPCSSSWRQRCLLSSVQWLRNGLQMSGSLSAIPGVGSGRRIRIKVGHPWVNVRKSLTCRTESRLLHLPGASPFRRQGRWDRHRRPRRFGLRHIRW